MRIYLAGMFLAGTMERIRERVASYPHMLESYHYIQRDSMVAKIRKAGKKLFLDSGAFSAFTQGVTIKLNEYADYLHRNRDIIEFAANLDDLTGDKVVAADNTWRNQQRLESMAPKGLYILPVYHVREPTSYLTRLIDKYEFIALGGMVPESSRDLLYILDDLWDRFLTDAQGRPRVRVHGFGLTTFDLMLRYPWWSVDSTSWIMSARHGHIRLMSKEGRPLTIAVSSESPKRKDLDGHYDSMSPYQRREVEELVQQAGFTIEEVRNQYWSRDAINIEFYRNLMGRNAKTFKRHAPDLFI